MDAVSLNLSGKSYYPGPGVKKEELCSLEVSLLAPILRMFKRKNRWLQKGCYCKCVFIFENVFNLTCKQAVCEKQRNHPHYMNLAQGCFKVELVL